MPDTDHFTLPSDVLRELDRGALGLTSETWALAEDIAEGIDLHPVASGTSPTVNAAAALYLASLIRNEKRARETIGDVAGCSGAAISDRYPEIAAAIDDTDITDRDLSSLYQTAPAEDGLLDRVRRLFP